ncbi:MAG: exopolyphosphatase [Gammaproteobacteria bacterium]|nr:exopolyphosphatase [Gammaproteobacteria bacterium]
MTSSDPESAAPPDPEADPGETIAALDLGSNSFHMIVARFAGNRLMVLDRLKDMVRLAAGLDASNRLSPQVVERALASLERMGQRIRGLPEGSVRVVGTNTLRKARNGLAFVERASAALGHEVEIISGREEARLIYLGVSHSLEDNQDRRLVVDIGGGSTEVILGRQFQPETMDSLYMGCVGMSAEFFANGRITAAAMKAAELAARQELEPIVARYRSHGWDSSIGASGTILAIQDVVAAQGWGSESITADALKRLQAQLVEVGQADRLALPGLPSQRAPVFPGGVAILAAIFRSLGIKQMNTSSGALREGLLWDLLGRQHQSDIREQTVADLSARYHVDLEQALAVRSTALRLLTAVAPAWQLTEPDLPQLLRWAAQLHEIGMDIAYSQYHKHGSYLLQNLDMPGFSRTEQQKLALLVRCHRRKPPRSVLAAAPLEKPEELVRLALLLRCAVVMHRARRQADVPPLTAIRADATSLHLEFSQHWLRQHPLTRLDLAEEARYWSDFDVKLDFADSETARGTAALG